MNKLSHEIIEAASGRELDALVLEHLYGWVWLARFHQNRGKRVERAAFFPPSSCDPFIRWNFDAADWHPAVTGPHGVPRFTDWDKAGADTRFEGYAMPHLSSDGNAMLALLEKLKDRFDINIRMRNGDYWSVEYCLPSREWEYVGETLCEAVSRAALLAILAQQPDCP